MRISGCYMNMIWFRRDVWYGCDNYDFWLWHIAFDMVSIWHSSRTKSQQNPQHIRHHVLQSNRNTYQTRKKDMSNIINPRKIGCPNVHPISINFCWRVCPRTGQPYTTSPRIFEAPGDSEETNEDTSSQAWEALCKPFCPNILRYYFHQYIYYMYIRTCKYAHVLYINTIRYMSRM